MADGNTSTREADIAEDLGDMAEDNSLESVITIRQTDPDQEFSPKPVEDKGPTRQRIVSFLLWIMVGLLLIPFLMTGLQMLFGCKDAAKECKDIMTKELWEFVHIAFPALTGLLGTAIGFYFERNSK